MILQKSDNKKYQILIMEDEDVHQDEITNIDTLQEDKMTVVIMEIVKRLKK